MLHRTRTLAPITLFLVGLTALPLAFATRTAHRPVPVSRIADSLADARQRYVQQVLQSIAGREQLPAREVFQNVRILGDVPARQLLARMNMGYSRSLGVGCEHCHDVTAWSSDAKPAKDAARGMMQMTRRINQELLPAVQGLRGTPPTVNCTTCHRGQVTPALNLPGGTP